jgi:hypothetical protein
MTLQLLLVVGATSPVYAANQKKQPQFDGPFQHVLLISIDGMHALDYQNCSTGLPGVNNGQPYCPNLAALGLTGTTYSNASTSKPSDSFPGLMAIVSGGSPRSVGAFYDVAFDRYLAPPAKTTGNGVAAGPCPPVPTTARYPYSGTTTEYEEGIDIDQTQLNGGAGDGGISSIDPMRLVRDPVSCQPVWPWDFVRTNTIFGVIHAANGYTAWSDKHPAYSSVAGHGSGGMTLDDYYSPEINSTVIPLNITTPLNMPCNPIPDPSQLGAWTDSFLNIQCYDTLKVNAILNEIDGKTHNGQSAQVPNIFGMNFQIVSVGQKLIEKNFGKGGYLDAQGTPSAPLLNEIQFADVSIGLFVNELKAKGLLDSTLIVITAKHGQSPIDPNRFFPIPGSNHNNGITPATLLANNGMIPLSESPNNGSGIGSTEDDVSLLWLISPTLVPNAVSLLEANGNQVGMGQMFYGPSLTTMFNAPGLPPNGDPRTPDIIIEPNVGVIYTTSTKKQEEHGGFAHDDNNVMMLFSNPSFKPNYVNAPVTTMQVAPTILHALGLDPTLLQSVQLEGTPVLPAVQF